MLVTGRRLREIIAEELSREALTAFVKNFSMRHKKKWADVLAAEVGLSDDVKGAYQKGEISDADLDTVIRQYVEESGLQAVTDAADMAVVKAKDHATTEMQPPTPEQVQTSSTVSKGIFPGDYTLSQGSR